MNKHIFPFAFAVLLCVLSASCFPEPEPPEPGPEPPAEKMYYTLRLANDNSGTIGINVGGRALSNEIAQAFHDFFEVVFYYVDGSTHRVARTTWNVGETPELRNVYIAPGGTSYANVGVPASGSGSALLFAGSKDDKTLLAVGRLSHVDNAPGTTLLPNSSVVTFEVAALRAGTSFTEANSSFRTNFGSSSGASMTTTIHDDIFIHYVGKKKFPLYMLNRLDASGHLPGVAGRTTTRGEYTFNTVSGTTFTNYAAGIVLAGGYNCEVRNPRYIITEGLYQYSSIFVQDLREGLISMQNDNTMTAPAPPLYTHSTFQNPVIFNFITTNSPDGSIFALTFEIFVYNLTPRPTLPLVGPQDAEPVKWRLSTGMGTKWLDLDDGSGGEGGAVLLGSGDVGAWLAPYDSRG